MPLTKGPGALAGATGPDIEAVERSFDIISTKPAQAGRRIIGVDPGLSGAVAIMSGASLTVFDLPIHTIRRGKSLKRDLDLYELARLVDAAGHIDHAFVEQVGAMPGQGVTSMFAFGKAYGSVLGIIAANFIPVTLVTPGAWKKTLWVPAGKDAARARASQLMPQHSGFWNRAKDHGRAEAALISYYGARVAS